LAFLYIKKARNLWFRAFYKNQCGEEGIRTTLLIIWMSCIYKEHMSF